MAQVIHKEPKPPAASGKQQVILDAAHRWTLYNKLRNLITCEVQRKVFAGSFDWKSILDVDALLCQATVAVQPFCIQFVATPKGVTLRSVLTQACDAQEVFLVKSDVIKTQAMSIGGSLWFSTYSLWKGISTLATEFDHCF